MRLDRIAAATPLEPHDRSDVADPELVIEGVEQSTLRITLTGLAVRSVGSAGTAQERFWGYDALQDVRVATYGALGVVRATLRGSGTDMPLLLLEPEQMVAARRALDLAWTRIARRGEGSPAA